MAVSRSVLLLFSGILSFGAIPFSTAAVVVLIDAYPNTPQVSQGTTVVMVCHVSGVPSDTTVTYQWSCPNYGCSARGLQSDGNIVSRREEGNMIAIDVVNGTDSGDYACNIRSSGRVLGTATYRISNVQAGFVLTGRNGMIPLNSLFTSNSTILSPFEGAAGVYIRCGSTGGQPGWYNEFNVLVPMSTTLNIHFNSASDTGELWFDTMASSNREFRCIPQSGSLTSLSSFVGLFFLHQNKLDDTPRPIITATTAKSITLSWSPTGSNSNGHHVSYKREDLSISLPPTYIRSRGTQNRSVTLQDLEPGASYRINVWDFQFIYPIDHKVSSPFEMTVTTSESAPTAPRLLTVVRSTSTSVDLNWIPPYHPNGVIHYEVEYSTSENFVESTTINTTSNSTYHTVSDVPEFPQHYFRVVAVNSAGAGRSSSSNIVDICLGMEVYPSPPTEVMVNRTHTTCNVVVSWTPPTRGAIGCSGGITYTVTVSTSTSTGGVIVQKVTSTNTTVIVCSCAVTAVSVVAVNSIGSSKPGVRTVPAMAHGEPIDPKPPTEVMVEGTDTTCNAVVSWTPPTQGALTCSGRVTYTVTVSTSTGDVIVRNVTSTNTTVTVCSCAVTAVSVVAVSFIGSSKPGVWTVPTMVHGEPIAIDSIEIIVGGFGGGFGLATGIATVVVILVICYMRRKIDKFKKNKSPAKPEESQHTDIEVTANPSYRSDTVKVKLDKQKEVYESVDTYYCNTVLK